MTKRDRQPAPKPRKTVTLAEVRKLAKELGYETVTVLPWASPVGKMFFVSTPGLDKPSIAVDHPNRDVALAQMKAALLAARGSK